MYCNLDRSWICFLRWPKDDLITVEICPDNVLFLLYINGAINSVIIAPEYGLDDPGSNPCVDEVFRPSRPALGPTKTPVKWVQCLSQG